MLRPWVPLIAFGLLFALAWHFSPSLVAWAGGGLLLAALFSEVFQRLLRRWKSARTQRRAAQLDWKIIDSSMNDDRVKRDCERPETLGICTGRDCLVYEGCNFNIKKPLP